MKERITPRWITNEVIEIVPNLGPGVVNAVLNASRSLADRPECAKNNLENRAGVLFSEVQMGVVNVGIRKISPRSTGVVQSHVVPQTSLISWTGVVPARIIRV